ncbi:MAG: Ig-like domain-containing protein, partial [Terriglobales bacterium]
TALNQVVLPAPTTTKLSSSANPSVSDKKVVLTATVSSSAGTPTGSVTFRDSGTVLGTKRLSGAGTSSLTTIKLPTGSNGISATYGGSTDFGSSSSPPLTQVVLAATTATITSSANPSTYGEAVTLTAEVSSSEGAPPNGESVSFMSGKTVLGTGTLSGGSASFTTSALKVGTHSITAVYGGDATFAGSKSAAVRQVVEK